MVKEQPGYLDAILRGCLVALLSGALVCFPGCEGKPDKPETKQTTYAYGTKVELPAHPAPLGSDERVAEREAMVRNQIAGREDGAPNIRDENVLRAMREVPRHRFVPQERQAQAYGDHPLPIGMGQTISQPYIVALMTEAARVRPGCKVLEIGTGSGYGAAVASRIAAEVYTIEIIPELAKSAEKRLTELGYANVQVRVGDGYLGWPEKAPFDAIIVTAAPDHVPQPLVEQLAVGARLVIPVGPEGGFQELKVISKTAQGVTEETILPVAFVPMTGKAQEKK